MINSDHQDETPSSILWPEWVFNLITIIILALKNQRHFQTNCRYAGRSNQCLNERPDPEHIKDYTLLLSGSLFFKPVRHIADSPKNCLVIHLLQDFFAIELRRNKMSWCGEVGEGKSLIRRLSFSRSFMHTPLWSFLTGTHQSDVDLDRSLDLLLYH